ncbi:Radical SAM domain protein [Caldicellulosiruptor saccharolyticus DSM 8903]|uniref:Radical SAM domain protein n=1 Tax=Caldicellulosiruptor saccharolyticus (strain ATCC 43494 / DSM 8903 / Tp8T 6331) TaxID=351627 RepID=A4XIK0_CALS8|nr:radical SAM protein [Caldicellulosiruptor saccharolyticus]ABP66735.1 Radical SAM domain protein [Caldicellulosiruptor saccharolyticus DSM 8903]
MKVIWNLTRLCNWNCVICCVDAVHVSNKQIPEIQKRLILNGKELTFEEKVKIVNDLYNSGINSIDFSGGNLLLINDNIKLLQYAASKFSKDCLSISIPGNNLNFELICNLKDYVSKVEFTLDNVEGDKDGSRPNGFVELAKNAIKLCVKENITVCVSTVLKKSNVSPKNLSKIYYFLIENGVEEWEILRFYQVGRAANIYALNPDDSELKEAIKYIDELKKENIIQISYQHSLKNKIHGNVKCNALSHSIGIFADGTVSACAWALGYNGRPIDENFVLGKMPEQSLKDIIESDKALKWNSNELKNSASICQPDKIMLNNLYFTK